MNNDGNQIDDISNINDNLATRKRIASLGESGRMYTNIDDCTTINSYDDKYKPEVILFIYFFEKAINNK